MRTIQYFDPVSLSEKVKLKCRTCGKTRYRTVTVKATVNPYNLNDAGEPKTAWEVRHDLQPRLAADVAALKAEGIVCRPCETQRCDYCGRDHLVKDKMFGPYARWCRLCHEEAVEANRLLVDKAERIANEIQDLERQNRDALAERNLAIDAFLENKKANLDAC